MPSALIVDDMAIVRTTLSRIVATVGLEVLEAPDAESALDTYRRETPAVVLLDLHLGATDGLEVPRSLRTLNNSVRVIIVSAERGVATVRDVLEAGAVDFVAKPFVKARVIAARKRAVPEHILDAS